MDALFNAQPELFTQAIARIPMKRGADLEDLAGLTVFLASDASSYLTGQVIGLDGGFSLV